MTTIKDIAEYTGVSATTVSNVIHGRKNRVSGETVERIQKAIDELGYVPNLFARSLVSSSSNVTALISYVPTQADSYFADKSFRMGFLTTIESVLKQNGYYLMFRRVESVDELKGFLRNWKMDGLFITGAADKKFVEALSNVQTPIVYIDSYASEDICDVGHDDFSGGRIATEHLLQKGHERIAFVSSSVMDSRYMEQRYNGYLEALKTAGIEPDPNLVYESGLDIDSCRVAAEKIRERGDVTAVVATTDLMAAGLMAAFIDFGMSIPDDISIVGYDDTPLSRMITPRLTTIRQDMDLKAVTAAQKMVEILKGGRSGGRIVLPIELVVRDSVKEAR
ncbi:MAG: LacI family DNA-binding transcriptional regulator [Lachnospiraceae bacterium]|nr:LacI family DNA-binding transcriptional regulator [Lachnospiraceae bacterium]